MLICAVCSEPLDPLPCNMAKAKYCSPACKAKGYRRRKEGYPESYTTKRMCAYCSEIFEAHHAYQIYCDSICRAGARNERDRNRYNADIDEARARQREKYRRKRGGN